jgi:predicted nucleotidyltransferase component of viral defense system
VSWRLTWDAHPLLRHALVLKGGTALNLVFGAPQRLSVDLDFNYIAHAERERMLEDRPRMEAALAPQEHSEIRRRLGRQLDGISQGATLYTSLVCMHVSEDTL